MQDEKILFTVLFFGVGSFPCGLRKCLIAYRCRKKVTIEEVVVTGTRNETDVRHLPMTVFRGEPGTDRTS